MIGRLAIRSLTAHPVRSAVLAAGFGVGVAVMAILLGVAEIVLEQSRAPGLSGGGDVVVRLSRQVPARLVLAGTLQADALRSRIAAASPGHTATLFLLHSGSKDGTATRVAARGGIPSLERALGNEAVASVSSWRDEPADIAWTADSPDRVLRYIDRFHRVPDAPDWSASWAEWLYFNGRSADARFYLTFLAGAVDEQGRRTAGVRLQLERNGRMETFGEAAPITDDEAMRAPDLTIGRSSVRLDGLVYRIHVDLAGPDGRRVTGDLSIEASPGRLVPPLEITGARGWRSGYVVPVMSGRLEGTLDVNGQRVSLAGGTGYHDHNWGFWQGVSWQWGQAQTGDVSLLYGRVFPPPEAADPDRIPGFVGVLGPDGPLGYTDDVTITEENAANGRPRAIAVRARGPNIDLQIRFDVQSIETSQGTLGTNLDFLQMRGTYTVSGTAAGRALNFTTEGAAETFRGR